MHVLFHTLQVILNMGGRVWKTSSKLFYCVQCTTASYTHTIYSFNVKFTFGFYVVNYDVDINGMKLCCQKINSSIWSCRENIKFRIWHDLHLMPASHVIMAAYICCRIYYISRIQLSFRRKIIIIIHKKRIFLNVQQSFLYLFKKCGKNLTDECRYS